MKICLVTCDDVSSLRSITHDQQGISEVQFSHGPAAVSVVFDEQNLVADAGLVPLVRLAERLGLPGLVADRVRIDAPANSAGANPAAKAIARSACTVCAVRRFVVSPAQSGGTWREVLGSPES